MSLRKGDRGQAVADLQQLLIEGGYPISHDESKYQAFGTSTYDAVRQFQASHVDRQGHALTEDGIIGPETLWALKNRGGGGSELFTAPGWTCDPPERINPVLIPVIQNAVLTIGTVEEPPGSNRSPKIDIWTGYRGQGAGPPWCAYWVSAMYQQAVPAPFGVLGSTLKLKEWGERNRKVLKKLEPLQAGDIWCIFRSQFRGHTGIVTHAFEDGVRVATCEGNSGQAVRGLIRPTTTFSYVVRPIR